jgi:hypothetical protein
LVASVERDGTLLMNGKDPALYVAYDQNLLRTASYPFQMVSAFGLPDKLSNKDTLKIYLWNPKKIPLSFEDIRIECIEIRSKIN